MLSGAHGCRLVDKKNARRYDDCLSYSLVAAKKAMQQAGLDKKDNADAFGKLDLTKSGVLIGSGMGVSGTQFLHPC